MRSIISKLCLGLAVLGALASARPARADAFDDVITYVRTNGNCLRCEGETTIINLVLAAQAAHNAGDAATCRLRLQAALMCVNKPSREFVYVNPNDFSQLRDITQGGVKVPISVYFSSLAGSPVPIWAIFSYQLFTAPFSLNLDRAKDCGITAHDNIVNLLTIALGAC